MSGELHEISLAIGEMRSDMRSLTHAIEKLESRLETIETRVSADVNEMQALKNRGWGLLTGVTLIASGLGAFIASNGKAFWAIFVKG